MKKNLFLITEEEKRRILGLHESATKRGYLLEQEQTVQYYKDQTGKVIKLVGNYSAPLGSTPATPEEYAAQNKPVEGGGGQGAKVITNNDKSYDYKEENGKYYYSKKGQNQWVEAKGDINNPKSSLGAIKNLKWDTATPMPSPTNSTPKTPAGSGTPAGPGLSGFNADSDGNGIPDYLQTQNPQDKSALTTTGTQPTGTSGVAGTSGVQGTSVVAGTSGVQGTNGVKLLDRVPTNKEIRQGFRRRKRINNRMDRQKRKQLDDLYNQYEKIGGSIQKFASRDDGSPEFKQQIATLENQIKNINAQIDKLEST
jgi:hypothetical protein